MKGKFVFLTLGFAISFQALAEEPIPTQKQMLNNPPPLKSPSPVAKKIKRDRRPEGSPQQPIPLIVKAKKKTEGTAELTGEY